MTIVLQRSITMSIDDGRSRILAGISRDAEQEAKNIIEEAEKMARERISLARGKADKIRKDADSKATTQANATRATILSGIAVEQKREQMKKQDEILQELLAQVRSGVAATLETDEYPSILQRLIIEASIGLNTSSMTVNASEKERTLITDEMLLEIGTVVSNQCGYPVSLSLSSSPALVEQGVIVTAKDGRTAFNNCITTRMRRFDQDIRNRVYDTLFTGIESDNNQTRQTEES